MKKKGIWFLIVAVVAAMAMAGCAHTQAQEKDNSLLKGKGPVTVVVVYRLTVKNNTAYEAYVDVYEPYGDIYISADKSAKGLLGRFIKPGESASFKWESAIPPLAEVVEATALFGYDGNFVGDAKKKVSYHDKERSITFREWTISDRDINYK